jgi:hypothetical protein
MMGNILNPNSSMAQKMADTLNAELEAHSVFSSMHSSQSNMTGPPLPSKMVASVSIRQLNIQTIKKKF